MQLSQRDLRRAGEVQPSRARHGQRGAADAEAKEILTRHHRPLPRRHPAEKDEGRRRRRRRGRGHRRTRSGSYLKREGATGQVPKPKTTPANVPLLLDEIALRRHRRIAGAARRHAVGEKVRAGLHRFLTVHGTGKVNLNTAPLVVLKALFPNASGPRLRAGDHRPPPRRARRRRHGQRGRDERGSRRRRSGTARAAGQPVHGRRRQLTDGSVQGLTAGRAPAQRHRPRRRPRREERLLLDPHRGRDDAHAARRALRGAARQDATGPASASCSTRSGRTRSSTSATTLPPPRSSPRATGTVRRRRQEPVAIPTTCRGREISPLAASERSSGRKWERLLWLRTPSPPATATSRR